MVRLGGACCFSVPDPFHLHMCLEFSGTHLCHYLLIASDNFQLLKTQISRLGMSVHFYLMKHHQWRGRSHEKQLIQSAHDYVLMPMKCSWPGTFASPRIAFVLVVKSIISVAEAKFIECLIYQKPWVYLQHHISRVQ